MSYTAPEQTGRQNPA